MQIPMLLYAVLALSSRHQSILAKHTEHEASFYHGQCLRLVIEALSLEVPFDEALLATVVLLRVHEELDTSTDGQLQLRAIGRLLTAIPTFAHSGGLAEAACWQSLRQDIFIALINQSPPSLQLEDYEYSEAFRFRDEAACANVIVLLFAKLLRTVFDSDHDQTRNATHLSTLDADVERWHERTKRLFRPIFTKEVDFAKYIYFTILCMLNAPQMVAMQHYYACKMLIKLHETAAQQSFGFHGTKRRRAVERYAIGCLEKIVGIALSNRHVEHPKFMAHHMLLRYGYLISHPTQREIVLHLLRVLDKEMGWSTAHTATVLQTQWSDLDQPTS